MDEEERRVPEQVRDDKVTARLNAEVAFLKSVSDPTERMRELLALANDPSLWVDEDGNVR